MINIKKITAIARAEMRLTRRLVRYWVFLAFSYFAALAAYAFYSYWHGPYSSYSATIGLCSPHFLISYVGAYYLLVYVIGTVFLAFDVRARDMREQMDEVLDSRPYSNLELVIGRFLGILTASWIPMLVLAILIELLGLLLVALGVPFGEPVEVFSLSGFLIVMGIPAVSFVLSLVFFVTLLVRNRLVAAVLLLILLGFDYWAIFSLPLNYGRLFDFLGILYIKFPSDIMPSMFDGMGLIHQLGVLLVSFGLLGITTAVHPRLDKHSRIGPALGSCIVFIIAIGFMGFCHYRDAHNIKMSELWMTAHTVRINAPVPDIQSISGNVGIVPGKALDLDIDLSFRAPEEESIKIAIFTLNPGQKVKEALDASGQPLPFNHENGLLEFILPRPLGPGEETSIHLSIGGQPDERFAYLESALNPDTMTSLELSYMELLGDEPAIFDSRFVALMPGIRWLPASGPEKGRDDPRIRAVDYFNVDLSVDLPNDWLAAGPGRRHRIETEGSGTRFRFSPQAPVPNVALIASRFESRSIEVDGVLMELLIHRKHTKNLEIMAEAGGHIRTWIEERLLEVKSYGLSYPYDGLTLVEVPNQFRTYGGGWRMGTALAPPGLLLMREASFPMARFDTAFRKPDEFTDREGGLAKAKFDRLRSFFSTDISGGDIISGATRNFFIYQTNARGPEALALNFVMESLSSLLIAETKGYFSTHAFTRGMSINLLIGQIARRYLGYKRRGKSMADAATSILSSRPEVWDQILDKSLKDMDPWENPALTLDILSLKGNAIAQSIMDTLGRENTGRLLSSLCEKHKGQSYTYNDMLVAGQALGYDLKELLGDWFGNTELPGFVVQNHDIYRLPDSEVGTPRYQLLFTVRNDESTPGVFRFVYYTEGQERSQRLLVVNGDPIRMAGRSAIRFGMVTSQPATWIFLEPYLSLNRSSFFVPVKSVDPEKIEEKEPIEGLEEVPWSLTETDYIIVDDLDPGFKILTGEQRNGLRLNTRGTEGKEIDQGLPVVPSDHLPAVWSRGTATTCWGKYRRTMALIKAGKGNQKAIFTTAIPHAGTWDLELYLPNGPYRDRNWGTWNLVVTDSNGDLHEIQFDADAGAIIAWNLVGSLDLPAGVTSVTLSDKTDGERVVADAIRWSPL